MFGKSLKKSRVEMSRRRQEIRPKFTQNNGNVFQSRELLWPPKKIFCPFPSWLSMISRMTPLKTCPYFSYLFHIDYSLQNFIILSRSPSFKWGTFSDNAVASFPLHMASNLKMISKQVVSTFITATADTDGYHINSTITE